MQFNNLFYIPIHLTNILINLLVNKTEVCNKYLHAVILCCILSDPWSKTFKIFSLLSFNIEKHQRQLSQAQISPFHMKCIKWRGCYFVIMQTMWSLLSSEFLRGRNSMKASSSFCIWFPYLGHRHLLHRVHHVRGLFTPVAFDYVAL